MGRCAWSAEAACGVEAWPRCSHAEEGPPVSSPHVCASRHCSARAVPFLVMETLINTWGELAPGAQRTSG